MSSTEAEYYGLVYAVTEVLWLRYLLTDLGYSGSDLKPFLIHEDNKSAIALAKTEESKPRRKYIDVKYHYIRNTVAHGEINVQYLSTDNMVVDGLTKALGKVKFERYVTMLGLTG